MPLYDYTGCPCGTFETFQHMSEDALTKCGRCGGAIHRVIHAPRFAFKRQGEKPSETTRRMYEQKLGRKVEKDESFYTEPESGEVVPMKGLNDRQKREAVAAARNRAVEQNYGHMPKEVKDALLVTPEKVEMRSG